MNRSTHPVEPEEVMTYLDGELKAPRAAAVAAHLEQCGECQALAAELRSVSQQLAAWQVEPTPLRLTERVTEAVRAQEPPQKSAAAGLRKFLFGERQTRPLVRRWVWAFAGGFAALLLVASISIPNLLRSRSAMPRPPSLPAPQHAVDTASRLQTPGEALVPAGPMLVRTATLAIVTKEFESARGAIERILRQHQGYVAQLNTSGQSDRGRTLTATLRVPVEHLDAVLAELKKLGRLLEESQASDEVTAQYVDLVARLANARNTEQRLVEVLRERTGKVADILAVEQEIARVRGEIERMEAQRKNLQNQVQFATVQLQLSEEYKAELEAAPPSTGRRLRNAMVEGYRAAVENTIGLALFLLRYGPTLLFWFAVLFWPTRSVWRRLRALAL